MRAPPGTHSHLPLPGALDAGALQPVWMLASKLWEPLVSSRSPDLSRARGLALPLPTPCLGGCELWGENFTAQNPALWPFWGSADVFECGGACTGVAQAPELGTAQEVR